MSFVQVSENRFINPAQVVEFTYTPQVVKSRKKKDSSDWGGTKTVPVTDPSSLHLTLNGGTTLSLLGSEADKVYGLLTKMCPQVS